MISRNDNNFNYYSTAIIGAGCSGLSLAYQLTKDKKNNLIILDPHKLRKDHIWAFWDNGKDYLKTARSLAIKKWDKWSIKTNIGNITLSGDEYKYTALSSVKFENYLREKISREGSKFQKGYVTKIRDEKNKKLIFLENDKEILANNVFDTRPPTILQGGMYQHFIGWNIEADYPIFEPNNVTLMDFRVDQSKGIHFIYVLPFSTKKALIESTVFSTTLLPDEWYEKQIKNYMISNFSNAKWVIKSKENGIIPLTNLKKNKPMGISIGMNANAMRASSGYAFAQIQKQIKELSKLKDTLSQIIKVRPGASYFEQFMDKVFLNVLKNNPKNAPEIFMRVFDSLTGDEFAKFMNGYSPLSTKIKIIKSQEKRIFLHAALKSIFT